MGERVMPFVEKTVVKTKECAGTFICRYKVVLLICILLLAGTITGIVMFADK